MAKKKERFEYKFLSDRPLKEPEDLEKIEFGHSEIGKTLSDIIEKTETPFTIGLFGKWGTGKSTIAYLLNKELNQKNIPVIIFDIWKHEKDALRRTFLRELFYQLKERKQIKSNYELDERLEKNKSIQTELPKIKIDWKKIFKFPWRFIILVLLFILIIFGIDYFFLSSFIIGVIKKIWDKILIFIVAVVGVILLFLKPVLKIIIEYTDVFYKSFFSSKAITYTIDKFTDPHEFQSQFEDIIKNIKNKRILIIFDNLDRVSSDKALEVLTTIKTFLEPSDELIKEKEIVFLVPCDAQALKDHIKEVYQLKNTEILKNFTSFDPDEFLRKFFNSTIWIPDFIQTELERYTRTKLQETKVSDFDNDLISALITVVFRDNPRQIIQFINILLANYLIISERTGKDKDFEPSFLKDNITSLCRYILLQHLFPEIMRKIKRENITNIDILDSETIKKMNAFGESAETFIDISNRTKELAPLDKISRFLYLRRSKEEKQFPGIEEFFVSLEDGKKESSLKFIQQIINYDSYKDALSLLIKDRLGKINNNVMKTRFIDTLLYVLDKENKNLENISNSTIYNVVNSLEINHFALIQPDVLDKIILKRNRGWLVNTINKWIDIISLNQNKELSIKLTDDFLSKLLNIFIIHINDLEKLQITTIQKNINQNLFYKEWAGDILTSNTESQKLLSIEYINGYLNDIEKRDIIKEINIITKVENSLFDLNISLNLIKKITVILNLKKDDKSINIIFQQLNNLSKVKREIFQIVNDQISWEQLFQIITVIITSISLDEKKVFIPLCFSLWVCTISPIKAGFQRVINTFIQNSTLESIKYFIENIEKNIFIEENSYISLLETRSYIILEFTDYLYDTLYDNELKKFNYLIKLINNNLRFALIKIKTKHDNLPQPKNIINEILKKFNSVDEQGKLEILEICDLTKCSNDENIITLFSDKIKSQLTNTDKKQQVVIQNFARDKKFDYLSEDKLRDISAYVFDWIKHQGAAGNNYILPIKFIFDLHRLPDEENKVLTYYIFQTIRTSNDISELEVAEKLLNQIKPKIKDHQNEFIDVRNRINSEINSTIKKYLLSELIKLKPSKMNENEKEYWESIEKLKIEKNDL